MARNTGTVRKRGSSFMIDVHVGADRVRRMAPTRQAAQQLLDQIHRVGRDPQAEPYVSLEEVLKAYVTTLQLRGKRTTVGQAEVHSGHLLKHFGAGCDAVQISSADIDAFAKARLAEVKRSSVNGSLRVLRAALNHAYETKVLARHPVKVKTLRETKLIPTVLTAAQVDHLIAAAPSPIDLALLLAARAGLRHQEILHLQRTDIDLDGGRLKVSAKLGWSPKAHCERVVPLTARVRDRLRQHLDDLDAGDWIFPGLEKGKPRRALHHQVKEVFKAAGLYQPGSKPGLHMLRRTFASSLLGTGTDINTVKELGGWASLDVVQRYLSSSDGLKRSAVERLERS